MYYKRQASIIRRVEDELKLISARLYREQIDALKAMGDLSKELRRAVDFYLAAKISDRLTLETVRNARRRLGIK